MKNSTIIPVLKTLDKKECREFSKWLASPFFNQRQDVIDLFQYLTAGQHLTEEKFLLKERIYRKLFPKESYDDAKFRQTVHFLYKQLEQFIAYKEIERDEFAYAVAYLRALRKRNVPKVFQNKFKAMKRQGLGSQLLDNSGLKHSFALYDEHSSLLGGIDRTKDIHLQECINAFDTLFIAEKLKYACLALSHQQVFRTTYESKFFEEVIKTVETEPDLLDYPAIAIYYYGYLVQRKDEDSDEYYFSLKSTLQKHLDVFGESEQRDIYLMKLNYCIQRINKGATNFQRELFEIYQDTFESKIILENDVLSRRTYLNAIMIALRFKAFDWVENVIKEYTHYLEPEYQKVFRDFCEAKLAFELGNYSRAQQLLLFFDSNDILISMNAKTMLLKIYYEEDEHDALESLLESMKVYLKRKKVIGYHKDVFQNMLKYTKKLVRINPFDKEKRVVLRQEIENASPLTDRPWLLEQIDKMGGGG
ncbi:hypothetical protein [Lewinella cohaerens]|uniref:hypothetical protein n=1 Tax=Lewinella cohaerens TaxID=70995 RepID=UPI0003A8C57B|nr:hypothetical protein [Lewinella cohaerens]